MSSIADDYLTDLGRLIAERALAAKRASNIAVGSDDRTFAAGRLSAWHEVVSLMEQQAIAFGLAPAALGLGDLRADRDLN